MALSSRRAGALLLLALPLLTALLCLGVGRYSISLWETLHVLFSPLTGEKIDAMQFAVVFKIRLPRILQGALCGAALAVSGAAFQSLFNNPLAVPDTLGVASAASCGAVIALMLRWNLLAVQATALIFGLIAVLLTWSAARIRKQSTIVMIVLAGIVISALFDGLLSLLKYVADPEEALPTITYWLMGSLSASNYYTLALGTPMIGTGLLTIFLLRWRLNILSLGEDEARSMGIHLRAMRFTVIFAAAAMTASCVSMCGKIGWIGLLIPHLARMVGGGSNQRIIPLSLSFGAAFTLCVDTVARSVTAAEIPVSILTAIVGAPVFIMLLRSTQEGGMK